MFTTVRIPTAMRVMTILGLLAPVMTMPAGAQDVGSASPETLSSAYTGKVYSPYAERRFPERPLWGDSHLHTSLSMDAGLFGNRLPPRDAYRFARGEQVVSSTGQPVRLSRPLDWLVVADHSDGMGMIGDLDSGEPQLMSFEQGARWSKGLQAGRAGRGRCRAGSDRQLFAGHDRSRIVRALFTRVEGLQDDLGRCHRRRRAVQRSRPLYRADRLRVDLSDPGQQHASGRDLARRRGQGAAGRAVHADRTARESGPARPVEVSARTTRRRPPATSWRSHITAIYRTASCSR